MGAAKNRKPWVSGKGDDKARILTSMGNAFSSMRGIAQSQAQKPANTKNTRAKGIFHPVFDEFSDWIVFWFDFCFDLTPSFFQISQNKNVSRAGN